MDNATLPRHLRALALLLLAALALSAATPAPAAPAATPRLATTAGTLNEPAYLVKDFDTRTQSSHPVGLTAVGETLFFVADNGSGEQRLWRTTAGGVTSIGEGRFRAPGPVGSANGLLFFIATSPTELVTALWRSDGTEAGTVRLVESWSNPLVDLAVVNDTVFLSAGNQLWKTNGTPAGTQLVKSFVDIPGDFPTTPNQLTNFNGTLFFAADNGVNGVELWKSDGTSDGTVQVKDLYTGSECALSPIGTKCSSSVPFDLTVVGNTLFFTAQAQSHLTRRLWKSDGTAVGTVPIPEPNQKPLLPSSLINLHGTLLFVGEESTHGTELWRSDGTAGGTQLLKDIIPGVSGSVPRNLTIVGDELFFSTQWARNLWKSDGTTAGTILVKERDPDPTASGPTELVAVGNEVYFAWSGGAAGISLWKSNGHPSGTIKLADVSATALTAAGARAYFVGTDAPTGAELWVSDGTRASTRRLIDLNAYGYDGLPTNLVSLNGALYFFATDSTNQHALWKSNGTAAGTTKLKVFTENESGADLRAIGGSLYVVVQVRMPDRTWKSELRKIDDTPAGMTKIFDTSYVIADFRGLGGKIILLIHEPFDGGHAVPPQGQAATLTDRPVDYQIWSSAGTPASATLLKRFDRLPNRPTIAGAGSRAFFVGYSSTAGGGLWQTDGTLAGTTLVKAFNPGDAGWNLGELTMLGSTLYFRAVDDVGLGLWMSDGTALGTTLLKRGYPSALTAGDAQLYFLDQDDQQSIALWRSNGTPAGTTLVKELEPASAAPYFSLAFAEGKVFVARLQAETDDTQLWSSDGTPDGTQVLMSLSDQQISGMTAIDGTLLFGVSDRVAPLELGTIWRSDGTAAGTSPVAGLDIGANTPAFVRAGERIFFAADDGRTGQELWALPAAATPDLALAAPTLVGAAPGGSAMLPIAYNNLGTPIAGSVVLTATLAPGLSYLGDTSGISPTISGGTISWRLPDVGYLSRRELGLRLGLPGAPYGTRYPVALQIGAAGADARPTDNQASATLWVAHRRFLPAVGVQR